MDNAVKCAMCGSENMAIVWTERLAVTPYIRSDGTIGADASSAFEPQDQEDEKLVCLDCGHDKEKVDIVWD